jgi:hypothetical protein
MADVDVSRFTAFLAWGVSSSVVWLLVLRLSWRSWRVHRDRRSKRELLRDAALMVTALGSTIAVVAVLFGEYGGTPRSIALAAALGTFLGAGIVSLGLRRSEEKGEAP